MENLTTTIGPARKNTAVCEARASTAQNMAWPRSAPACARWLTNGSRESARQIGEGRRTTA